MAIKLPRRLIIAPVKGITKYICNGKDVTINFIAGRNSTILYVMNE